VLAVGSTLLCVMLLVAAALHDTATRTIPDWISVAILFAGLISHLVLGGVLAGIGVGLVVFACMFLLWLGQFVGGGDVKLAAATAAAIPASSALTFVLAVALAGGAVALLYLVLSLVVRRPAPGPRGGLLARVCKAEAWRISRRGPIPYAAAIAAGGLFVLVPGLLPALTG